MQLMCPRNIIFLLVLLCGNIDILGQSRDQSTPDSLSQSYLAKSDSLLQTAKLSRYSDSLKILTWGDSMRVKVNKHFSKLRGTLSHSPDSLEKLALSTNRYKRKMDSLLKVADPSSKVYQVLRSKQDSLKKIKLPTTKYTRQADKLAQKQQKMIAEVSKKQQDLQQKVTGRYSKWEGSVRSKLKLDSLGIKMPGQIAGLKQPNINGVSTNLPGVKTPNLNQNIAGLPKMPTLNTGDFQGLGLSKELSSIGGNLSVPSIGQLDQLGKNTPGLSNNPLGNATQQLGSAGAMLKDPSKAAENAIGQVGDVKALNSEISSADKLMKSNEAMQVADKMKTQEGMQAEVKKQAVNHFAGKEEILQKSMDQMAKYKKKYHSLGSLADAKKMKWWQPVNGLNGKPFRERFHPGMNFGYNTRKDTFNLDLFPNANYQISGRIEAGVGALYRLHFNTKNNSFDQANPVWGLTMFSTVKLFNATRLRIETDAVNSPMALANPDGSLQRNWRWQMIVGIQNNFNISRSVTGNMQMLYNFDRKLKDAFPERLTLRVGVAFNLKAKKK